MRKDKEYPNHFYSFAVILGSEDDHIIPHPNKKDVKELIIPDLKRLIKELKKIYF